VNNQKEQAADYVLEQRRPVNGSVFERHAQTVLAGLVGLGILWIVSSLNDLNKSQTETGAEIRILKYEVAALSSSVSAATNNYVKVDSFTASKARCLVEIEGLKARVRELETHRNPTP